MKIEEMTRDELKRYRATQAADFEANIKAISIRKAVLQKLGLNANKGKTQDETLIRLYEENEALLNTLSDIRKAMKKLPPPEQKPRKPRGERPQGMVHFGREWEGVNAFQKRLIILMARAIGQERYQELKRIATDDYRNRENRYYSGSAAWNGGEPVVYEKAWEADKK